MSNAAAYKLNQRTDTVLRLRATLVEEFAGDEQAIRDTIEGATDLHDLIGWASKEMMAAGGMSAGISIVMNDMAARRERLQARVLALRQAIEAAMLAGEIMSLPLPHVTLSISKGRSGVTITDAAAIPDEYRKPPKVPEPDKNLIKAALEAGETVAGAVLSNPSPHLVTRTK